MVGSQIVDVVVQVEWLFVGEYCLYWFIFQQRGELGVNVGFYQGVQCMVRVFCVGVGVGVGVGGGCNIIVIGDLCNFVMQGVVQLVDVVSQC